MMRIGSLNNLYFGENSLLIIVLMTVSHRVLEQLTKRFWPYEMIHLS